MDESLFQGSTFEIVYVFFAITAKRLNEKLKKQSEIKTQATQVNDVVCLLEILELVPLFSK